MNMNAPVTPQQTDKYAAASTLDHCSFSVDSETLQSESLDQLQFSAANKPWSLAMRTSRGSSLIDGEDIEHDDELPLNQMSGSMR